MMGLNKCLTGAVKTVKCTLGRKGFYGHKLSWFNGSKDG